VKREALEDAAPRRGGTAASPSQAYGILPLARLTEVTNPLTENPFICGYVIRGRGHRFKQIIPSVDQIRRIRHWLPIVLSSVPEAKTSDSLLTGAASVRSYVG
jgi:hypothetical protein